MKLQSNKRGAMPDFISDVFSFFLYLLFFVCFLILFALTLGGCEGIEPPSGAIISAGEYQAGEAMLLQNYLSTPVIVDGRSLTFAELAAESCLNNNYEKLISETAAFMKTGPNKLGVHTYALWCDPADSRHRDETEFFKSKLAADCRYDLKCTDDIIWSENISLPFSGSKPKFAKIVIKGCSLSQNVNRGRAGSYTMRPEDDEAVQRCLA
jgi:hypothetical protein